MQIVTETLPGEGFGQAVTSYRDGGQVIVVAYGHVVAQWPVDDPVARDVFIAAGARLGWQGTTLAALAGCAPSWVSRVRARAAQGGFAALAQRSAGGRPETLTAAQRTRALALRAEGLTIAAIAARLHVAPAVVGRLLRGIKAPASQDPLPLATLNPDEQAVPTVGADSPSTLPTGPEAASAAVVSEAAPPAPAPVAEDSELAPQLLTRPEQLMESTGLFAVRCIPKPGISNDCLMIGATAPRPAGRPRPPLLGRSPDGSLPAPSPAAPTDLRPIRFP